KMQPRAGVADPLREASLQSGMAILILEADPPRARGVLLPQRLQTAADGREIFRRKQTHLVEHRGVSERGADIVRNEPLVEAMVLAGRVAQHPLVERLALVPQA